MKEFFANMDTAQQIYWYIAIGASVIFIIQTVMTFVGADADGGVDADFDGNLDGVEAPFQLFSLRNLINFLLGMGWTGASMYGTFDNKILLGVVATVIGLVFVGIFFFIMRSFMRLAEDNSFKIEDAVGKTGDVYTTVPANKNGKGKVFVSVKGSTRELSAITSNEENLTVGTLIKVIGLEDGILIVQALEK
ncbi:NfeD family protein [Dysgonomonas sp. 25]|uniref:NfeD family protein n=1 Tax=Dysgonomonas sp. 25 TaxID=2302933 RepID=UPI0013D6FDA9|nr:NfeD family protein [Dysgonomonas sp. 25]NDV67332.1 serine protease [Dysgonomonas sp. 25]